MRPSFASLDFEAFKALAQDPSASPHEKIGFPDAYRAGKEGVILRDMARKLTNLRRRGQRVADIGPGCGLLARALLELSAERGHTVFLIDSAEMLALLPETPRVSRIAARFPQDCLDFVAAEKGSMNVVIAYSLLHYVFAERGVFDFLDRALELLAPGGQLLVGDIPNSSMRRRFFASAAGVRFHQRFTGSRTVPEVTHDVPVPGAIDDAVLIGLMLRARAAGMQAWLLPQAPNLPMANRREDLLVVRP